MPVRARFTVRWMIVAVGLIAGLIAVERTHDRWRLYRARAAWYADTGKKFRGTADVLAKGAGELTKATDDLAARRPLFLPGWGKFDAARDLRGATEAELSGWKKYLLDEASQNEQFADHCARFEEKWRLAASRPWSLVVADPPLPWYARDVFEKRRDGVSLPPDWKPSLPP